MKRKIRILVYVIALPFLLLLPMMIGGGIITGVLFNPRINENRMERIFIEDYELLVDVLAFLVNLGPETVFIRDDMGSGEMSIGGKRIEIGDADAIIAINKLKSRGFRAIEMDGNTVSFLRWSMRNRGRGIAFSLDGNEPVLPFLTRLVPLSKTYWYYYEEDFYEWRRHNQNN